MLLKKFQIEGLVSAMYNFWRFLGDQLNFRHSVQLSDLIYLLNNGYTTYDQETWTLIFYIPKQLVAMKPDTNYHALLQNWMAFSKLHKPLFTEHGFIKFPNTNPPKDEDNNAYCEVSYYIITWAVW